MFVLKLRLLKLAVAPLLAFGSSWSHAALAQQVNPQAFFRNTSENSSHPQPYFRLTSFYDAPQPLPYGKPGGLIRSEPFDDYELPVDASAVRILYHSTDSRGNDVAASGVVLVPDLPPPPGGWPLIAWAHPFISAARPCAPSLMKNLHNGPLFSMYLKMGYALVATDYVGLGTAFHGALLDLPSNAADVIYSVQAARRAVPSLGSKWIAVGEGDGASAVLEIAEFEARTGDSGFLGSVAIGVAGDVKTMMEGSEKADSVTGNLVLYSSAIRAIYPAFQIRDILTPGTIPAYKAENGICSSQAVNRGGSLEQLKPHWQDNPFVIDFAARNTLGLKPARAPILVISEADSPSASVGKAVATRMCARGDTLDFETFGADPGSLVGDAIPAQIAWIRGRFSALPAPHFCPLTK